MLVNMTLAAFDLPGGPFALRRATATDVSPIVQLLADDPLGRSRESAEPDAVQVYMEAFAAIDEAPAQLLVVAESPARAVVATMQLTFIPGLARQGATRMQIEAVRVREELRGNGLGGAMVSWAIEEARARNCGVVQLTSERSRERTHGFCVRLGFEASHVGFKLLL